MAVSKVVLGDETLIDLTGDSVSSENLLQGATAHAANGEQITGGVVVTPMYTGTKAAIEEAITLGQIPEDAVVNITDDEETSSFQTQINEINSSLKTKFLKKSYTISANGYISVDFDIPSGFTVIGFSYFSTGSSYVFPYVLNGAAMYLHNVSDTIINATAEIQLTLTTQIVESI